MAYYFLGEDLAFPPVEQADEHGILALGGDLSTRRLLLAYQSGIFPWYSREEPIIWWAPDPRFVLYPDQLKVSKSMRQVLRSDKFSISLDLNFQEVIDRCQQIERPGQYGTWITGEMRDAYLNLHKMGYAHSVEVWQNQQLVGGLYGVSLGSMFFGESMFTNVSNASKVGFMVLVKMLFKRQFSLIDCQVHTKHLESLGAISIPRPVFMVELAKGLGEDTFKGSWSTWLDSKPVPVSQTIKTLKL